MNTKMLKREIFQEERSKPVAAAATEVLHDIWVPQGCLLRLIAGNNGLDTVAAIGSVYWTFLVDGYTVSPYEKIYDISGATRQPLKPIEVRGGSRLQIKAVNGWSGTVKMGYDLEWEIVYSA